MNIKKDDIFLITAGVYSDYTVYGLYRALADFETRVMVGRWLDTLDEPARNFQFLAFVHWLVDQGMLENVEMGEWHLGDYKIGDEDRFD